MLEHFKGEEVFVKKILEYKDQALYKQKLILTPFYNPYHQSIVRSLIGKDEVKVYSYGGFVNSESQRMIICPDFYEIEEEDFSVVKAKIIYAKNFEKLSHRDILGALMSLGIKRELFGDIVEKDKDFYISLDRKIYEYLKDNLSQIKRSKVKFQECHDEIEVQNEYIMKQFIVSSYRLDKILSSFYKIPRNKAADYIRAGYVKVNHKPVEQINYLCNNRDMISFKGHGRVMFVDLKKQTRSDNYVVEGYFYK